MTLYARLKPLPDARHPAFRVLCFAPACGFELGRIGRRIMGPPDAALSLTLAPGFARSRHDGVWRLEKHAMIRFHHSKAPRNARPPFRNSDEGGGIIVGPRADLPADIACPTHGRQIIDCGMVTATE